jgi:glucose dehydrogenase
LQLGEPGSFQSSPLFHKGMGFVSGTYSVVAFDASTCERQWTYTAASEQGGWVIALDARHGQQDLVLSSAYANGRRRYADRRRSRVHRGSNGDFLTMDRIDGRVLYRFATCAAIGGGVSTYSVGNRQYVAVASVNRSAVPFGNPGAPTLLLFTLPSNWDARTGLIGARPAT